MVFASPRSFSATISMSAPSACCARVKVAPDAAEAVDADPNAHAPPRPVVARSAASLTGRLAAGEECARRQAALAVPSCAASGPGEGSED